MGVVTVTRIVLECDGCRAVFGSPVGLALNPVEARATAFADGWRFPNRVNHDGEQITSTNDVCPACAPDWKPRMHAPSQRQATPQEVKEWTR